MQLILRIKAWQETELKSAEPGWVESIIHIPHESLWSVAPYLDGIEGGAHGGAQSILQVYGTTDLHPWTWYLQDPAPEVMQTIIGCYRSATDSTRSSFSGPSSFRHHPPKPGHN